MKGHPLKSIKNFVLYYPIRRKGNQAPAQQSRISANNPTQHHRPHNGASAIHHDSDPVVSPHDSRESVSVSEWISTAATATLTTDYSIISNCISDFSNSSMDTGTPPTTNCAEGGVEVDVEVEGVGNICDGENRNTEAVGENSSPTNYTPTGFVSSSSPTCTRKQRKTSFEPDDSFPQSNGLLVIRSDAVSSQPFNLTPSTTVKFKNADNYCENEDIGTVTTDHEHGYNNTIMKRRATAHLENNRLISPPGANSRVTLLVEQHNWSNETTTFENDEMFPDCKMPFLPSASSIKQFLGLPPTPRSINIMEWISEEAPTDVVPQILSFVGSRKLVTLSTLNSKWRSIVLSEATWRTACEDTGKVCF